jgi:hypothetical protein
VKLVRTLSVLALTLASLPAAAQQALVDSAAIRPAIAPIEKVKIDSPKPKADRRIFWTGVSLLAASKTADAITTRRLLNEGGWETNPVYGHNPTAARQAGINAAFFAAEVGAFYLTEHSRYRWIRWTGRTYVGLLVANHCELTAGNVAVFGVPGKRAHSFLPF